MRIILAGLVAAGAAGVLIGLAILQASGWRLP